MNSIKKLTSIFLLALAGSLTGMGIYNYFTIPKSQFGTHSNSSSVARLVGLNANGAVNTDFSIPAELTIPTVVNVKTKITPQNNFSNQYMDPFGFFFGQPNRPQNMPQQEGSGSGVIISNDGYIVTNNHVIDNADNIEVTMDNKKSYTAKLIGTDPSTDLALLKIDAKDLPYIAYGNSDDVKIGQWVLAVGNPFNLTSTVTAGIVSAKARNINILPEQKFPIESFIQTDEAVNPGNSGGALVNTNGELIGINSAIASNTGSYAGYSFAIPVNIVKKVVSDLAEYGTVQRGFIGVSIRDLDDEFVKENKLKSLQGVYVNGLTKNGAAESSGIKIGDIITKINGVDIKTTPELQEQVGRYKPGDKLLVTVLRDDKEEKLNVVLRNKEGNTEIVKNDIVSVLGATLQPVDQAEMRKLRIASGVKVKDLESGKIKEAGIKEGFIITSIDNKAVETTDDVVNYLKQNKAGVLVEGVYANGMRAYYGFRM